MSHSTPRASVLLFDVMGTVCYDPFYAEVPRFLGMTLAEVFQAKDPTAWLEFELGTLPESDFLTRFFADRRTYDHEGLKECFRSSFRYLDGMEALFKDLHEAGHRLHLFSNYTRWYRWIEERLHLTRFAEWSCVSCEMGVRKPDAAAYAAALQRVEAPAAQCLFIDDRANNCRGAEQVGIAALQFENARLLRAEFEQRGLLVATS